MEKLLSSLLSFSLVLTYLILPISPTQATSEAILSETIKVVSYNLTNNNHVYPQVMGSGTIISSSGLILTNHHVVTDSYDDSYEGLAICVVTDKQEKPDCLFTASIIAKNKSLDIALLQINRRDIYGDNLPAFPYLPATYDKLPENNTKISVAGFPGIGGDTITYTEGLTSGIEEKEGLKQIKTDANISPGNSGGTATDSAGNFIGMPTYIRSNYNTLGYIVPMMEIKPWLETHLLDPIQAQEFARELLDLSLQRQYETDSNEKYVSKLFPQFELEIPKPWKAGFINNNNLVLSNTINGISLYVKLNVGIMPYDADEEAIQFVLEKIEKNQHQFTNYERVKADFHGLQGYSISFDQWESKHYIFFGGKENAMFTLSYSINIDNLEDIKKEIDALLASFKWLDLPNNTAQALQEYSQTHPDISIETFDDFLINVLYDSQLQNDIIHIENPNSFEQSFKITEEHLDQEYWDLSVSEILEKEIKYLGSNILNSYDDVIIDGLKGYAFSYTFQGDDFNQERKSTEVIVLKGKKYFKFDYDDLAENYDKNLPALIKTLNSFTYDGPENADNKGVYQIPSFSLVYEDIKNHLYEDEISALASKNLISIRTKNFYPERPITRLQAMQAIMDSKIFVEEGRNSFKTDKAIKSAKRVQAYSDQEEDIYWQMLNYAKEAGFISDSANFDPNGGVHLADALAFLCRVYELPVWEPPYGEEIGWHVPYYFKGIELGVIPADTRYYDKLTRGQFAHLLYKFVRKVGERSDL